MDLEGVSETGVGMDVGLVDASVDDAGDEGVVVVIGE
jgi:hypothetical protein